MIKVLAEFCLNTVVGGSELSKLAFLVDVRITRQKFITILLLVLNAFTWYLVGFEVIDDMLKTLETTGAETGIVWLVHYVAMVVATLAGPILLARMTKPRNALSLWMGLGALCSLGPLIVGPASLTGVTMFSLLLGLTFGLGMPSCMGYFAEHTDTERRGRLGGLVFLAIGLGTFLLLSTLIPFASLTVELAILAGWRAFGLISFMILSRKDKAARTVRRYSYFSIFRRRSLMLYLIPWIMFCLVDSMARLLFPPEIVLSQFIAGSAITGFSALVGGLFSDLVGRKPVVIAGFILLGVSYAILGISGAPTDWSFWYSVYTVVGSIAGGTFGAVFLMTVWGDLAEHVDTEKYYAIGGLPYLLSGYFGLLAEGYLKISSYATFSFASFFLFVAIYPLWLAPETLPQKVVQKRLIQEYVKNAEKVKRKFGKTENVVQYQKGDAVAKHDKNT